MQKFYSFTLITLVFLSLSNSYGQALNLPDADLKTNVKNIVVKIERHSDYREDLRKIFETLDRGANPNFYTPEDLSAFNMNDLSLFEAAILIAGKLDLPEIVETFLNKKADVNLRSQNGWLPVDYAVVNFHSRQTDSRLDVEANLKILTLLEKGGAKLSDARHAQKYLDLPSLQTIRDITHEVLSLKVLKDNGLIPESDFNGAVLGPQALKVDTSLLEANGAKLTKISSKPSVKYKPGDYQEIKKLQPPRQVSKNNSVSLFVTEPKSHNGHSADTLRIASDTNFLINPDYNASSIYSWSEYLLFYTYSLNISPAIKSMLNLNSNLQDRVIFSHSFGVNLTQAQGSFLQSQNDENSFDFQTALLFQNQFEKSKPIIFQAAGNSFLDEGNFVISFGIIHSPRTVVVGASARYFPNEKIFISPYSSGGADICAPIPKFNEQFMEGSSCATPLLAAMYKQFYDWYGDRLNFEDIMAAALLTADPEMNEFLSAFDGVKATQAGVFPNQLQFKRATFERNGGGLFHHLQCGAGVINELKWQEALDWMVANQTASSITSSQLLPFNLESDGVYSVTIPKDMTIGRLTFFLPQNRENHSYISVQMPSGFKLRLPMTTTDVLSTFAFAYEDVKPGNKIFIFADGPFMKSAGLVLRGQKPGNTIQKLRDHLRTLN